MLCEGMTFERYRQGALGQLLHASPMAGIYMIPALTTRRVCHLATHTSK